MYIWRLIKETNGDALGVILFILLIYYFISKAITIGTNRFENLLLASSTIALIVDSCIVYRKMRLHLIKNHLNIKSNI